MLRLLIWGDTAREKEQSQEILRLHAQLADLQEKHHQTQQEAARQLQKAISEFLAFLRPQPPSAASQAVEPDQILPGYRPSTAPKYPETPLWAKDEVPTAVPV